MGPPVFASRLAPLNPVKQGSVQYNQVCTYLNFVHTSMSSVHTRTLSTNLVHTSMSLVHTSTLGTYMHKQSTRHVQTCPVPGSSSLIQVHTMLWYDTAINRWFPVYLSMYHLVPLVGILANSASQRNAQYIQCHGLFGIVFVKSILSIPLKSQIN